MINNYLQLLGVDKHTLNNTSSYLFKQFIDKVKEFWETSDYQYYEVEVHNLMLTIWCSPSKLEEAKQILHKLGNYNNVEYLPYNPDHFHFGNKCREARIRASKLSIHPESRGIWARTEEILWIDNTNQWLWFVKDKKVKTKVENLIQ